MSSLSLQNYLNHASGLLGRDVFSLEGIVIFSLAAAVSTQLIYMTSNSLSRGHAEYPRSLMFSLFTAALAPLVLIGLESGMEYGGMNLSAFGLIFLSLILSGLLVTMVLAAGCFRGNIFSSALSILPAAVFWFFLIILLYQVDEALISGGEKAGAIKERTADLDQFLK